MEFELVIVMVLTSLKLSKCGILDKKKTSSNQNERYSFKK